MLLEHRLLIINEQQNMSRLNFLLTVVKLGNSALRKKKPCPPGNPMLATSKNVLFQVTTAGGYDVEIRHFGSGQHGVTWWIVAFCAVSGS